MSPAPDPVSRPSRADTTEGEPTINSELTVARADTTEGRTEPREVDAYTLLLDELEDCEPDDDEETVHA